MQRRQFNSDQAIVNTMNQFKPQAVSSIDLAGALENYNDAYNKAQDKQKQQDLADALMGGDEKQILAALAPVDSKLAANYLLQSKRLDADSVNNDLDRQIKQAQLANLLNPVSKPTDKIQNYEYFSKIFGPDKAALMVSGKGTGESGNFKEGERQTAAFADRMVEAGKLLNDYENSGGGYFGSGNNKKFGTLARVVQTLPIIGDASSRFLQDTEQQKYEANARNWVTANLRKESGAVIGQDEYDNEYKKYFPQPGDSAETIKNKQQQRKLAEQGLIFQSGGAYDALQNFKNPLGRQPLPEQSGKLENGVTWRVKK